MATGEICYFCGEETTDWHRNFSELKSEHSNTPMNELIERFLGGFLSSRNINNGSNCICLKCLNQINDYDWTSKKAIEQESALRDRLLTTELALIDDKKRIQEEIEAFHTETVFVNESANFMEETSIKIENTSDDEIEMPNIEDIEQQSTSNLEQNTTAVSNPISIDTSPNPKIRSTIRSNAVLPQKNCRVLQPHTAKRIFMRQNGKLMKVRIIKRGAGVQSIGALALNNLDKPAILKGPDGKTYRVYKSTVGINQPTDENRIETPAALESAPIAETSENEVEILKHFRKMQSLACNVLGCNEVFYCVSSYEVRSNQSECYRTYFK